MHAIELLKKEQTRLIEKQEKNQKKFQDAQKLYEIKVMEYRAIKDQHAKYLQMFSKQRGALHLRQQQQQIEDFQQNTTEVFDLVMGESVKIQDVLMQNSVILIVNENQGIWMI